MQKPPSFRESHMSDWSKWLIENALPDQKGEVLRGEAVPLARWIGPAYSAILFVDWMFESQETMSPSDYLSMEVVYLARSDDGWREMSPRTGGSLWSSISLSPSGDREDGVQFGRMAAVKEGSWQCGSVVGVAGRDSRSIRLTQGGESMTCELESPLGVFVVCVDLVTPACIEVHDTQGDLVGRAEFPPG